jgi:putative ABC transport system permease protein
MNTLWQDIRYSVRMLLKKPGFTIVMVITLAVGIGANTAIFSILNSLLLRPLPFSEPDRIVQVWETFKPQSVMETTISPHNFTDWKRENTSFESLAVYRYASFTLTDGEQPEPIRGIAVSSEFLSVFGATPALGRDFLAEEDAPGRNRVVILSHNLWQRRFNSDPEIIGQSLSINGEKYNVVGVMAHGFQFPDAIDLWSPLGADLARISRGTTFLFGVGRLGRGTTIAQAQSEMESIALNLEQQYPNTNTGRGVNLVPLQEQLVGNIRLQLWVLFGAVGFVLLIACANVAGLLLARAASRQKETAIRTAIGASRLRLARQFLTESVLLSVVGGGAGLLLALWGVDLMVSASPVPIPRATEIGIDGRVLVFTVLASLVTGLIFGLAPALQAARTDIQEALKESVTSASASLKRQRLRQSIVVIETAIALVLLVGAGLLINSFIRLQRVDTGFNPKNLLTFSTALPRARYAQPVQQVTFAQQALERIAAIEGVQSVGVVTDLPFSGSRSVSSFQIDGRPPAGPGEGVHADFRAITPDYFQAMKMPLLQGRFFTERDVKDSAGVIIINQEMARRYWSDEDPLGKRITIGSPEETSLYGNPVSREIVGVIGNVKHDELSAAPYAEMYVPFAQLPGSFLFFTVRSEHDAPALTGSIRSAVRGIDPAQAISNVSMMETRLSRSISNETLITVLLGAFAIVALMLAALGIYGIMSYSVTQRRQEIGIRMALGAQPRDILRMIVGQGLTISAIGAGLGLAASFYLARFLSSLLYGVSASDPFTFVGVCLLLMLVALLACYLPARRATKVDPITALRYE